MNQSKKTPEEAMRSAILKALVDGGHTIDGQEVRLFADPRQDGNALHQVTERIVNAALAASPLPQVDALDGARTVEALKGALLHVSLLYPSLHGEIRGQIIGHFVNEWNAAMKQGSN